MEVKKLKRAIIKEELVAITGDYNKAIILNQFLYWTEKMNDVDEYIEQENNRLKQQGVEPQELTYGWIYKTAGELSEETMMKLSDNSMRNHIKELEKMGFINSRKNPKHKWDKTLQYKVDIIKVAIALKEQGYSLDGYFFGEKITEDFEIPSENFENATEDFEIPSENFENATEDFEIPSENFENRTSENFGAIPKITTEITNKDYYRDYNTEITTETITEKKEKVVSDDTTKKNSPKNHLVYYPQDELLNKALMDFIEMRKKVRKPMTDKAIELLMGRLQKMSDNDNDKAIQLLNQSIRKGWLDIYPLKENETQLKQNGTGNVFDEWRNA